MQILNIELPGLAQLLYKTIFGQSLCFTLENVVRNQKIALNFIIPKHKGNTFLYLYMYIYTYTYTIYIYTYAGSLPWKLILSVTH